MRTFEEIKKWLRNPIPVHFHAGDREAHLTPLALYDLEALHSSALDLIQQQEITVLGVKAALATVKKKLAQFEWVSVIDELPEENTAVIVAFDDGHVFQALYTYDGWDLWEGCTGRVTHWMPLPKPPEEDCDV